MPPSRLEAKARAGPITSALERTDGRVAQHAASRPPPVRARPVQPAADTRSFCLPRPAHHSTATPESPRVPHPESEVSETTPGMEGETEARGTRGREDGRHRQADEWMNRWEGQTASSEWSLRF